MFSLVLFGLLFLFLTLSIPIGIALGLSTVISMWTMTNIPLKLVAQNAFAGLDSFPLLAIPFFILAGNLMTYGGISRRLLNLADAMVGHLVGGLGAVTTLACMFFSAISGSGPATVSAIGTFMIPEMKDKNYSGGYAAAVSAASGSIGAIIPPSVPFVLYGVVTGTSVGALFLAGVIPGILVGLALMAANYYSCRKYGYGRNREKAGLQERLTVLKDAFWALMVPVIILGGIYGGIFTPTEAAVVGVVYAVFVGAFVYKELGWKEIYDALKDTAMANGSTNYMVGLSMSFAFLITMKQIPAEIADKMLSIAASPAVLLILINLLLIFVGCFIDNISSMIILAPILLPIAMKIGVSPIHFGVLMTVNVALGFVTPPYGPNIFIAAIVSREPMGAIVKYLPPLLFAFVVCILLITFVPSLSLFLPNLLGLR